jgi:hypothetical protein
MLSRLLNREGRHRLLEWARLAYAAENSVRKPNNPEGDPREFSRKRYPAKKEREK